MNALGHEGPLKQMKGRSLKLHLGQQIILVLEYWVPFTAGDFVPSTWVHADAYPHRNTRQVSELEGTHEGQDVQRHAADIHRVSVSISLGKPGGHHVGITDRLHLRVDGWHEDVCGLCYLSVYLSIYRMSPMTIPCIHHGGPRCCQSPCRCRWACPQLPSVCCTGTEWWIRLCHWNILSLPRTALAPPHRSPSGFSPLGYTERNVHRQKKKDDPPVF